MEARKNTPSGSPAPDASPAKTRKEASASQALGEADIELVSEEELKLRQSDQPSLPDLAPAQTPTPSATPTPSEQMEQQPSQSLTQSRLDMTQLFFWLSICIFIASASFLGLQNWWLCYIGAISFGSSLYLLCSYAKKALRATELSLIKAATACIVPLLIPPCQWLTNQIATGQMWSTVPTPIVVPVLSDLTIIVVLGMAYLALWCFGWPFLLGRRCYAINHAAKVISTKHLPQTQFAWLSLLVNIGLLAGTSAALGVSSLRSLAPELIMASIWTAVGMSLMFLHVQKTSRQWKALEPSKQTQLDQIIETDEQKEEGVLIRYRAMAGMERWLKDRFAERSWKKAALMAALVAVFFAGGGPMKLLELLVWFFSLVGASSAHDTASAASQALADANASAINVLINMLFYPALAFMVIYIAKPTHLQLTDKGARFLWRHPMFKLNGRYLSWDKIDEIKLERPFGKTLIQDSSISLCGGGKSRMRAKLACIPSTNDKAAVLEAFESWAARTSRSAEVTEVLRPPADHSYTELWLQALTAPPKRERLKPLLSGVKLLDGRYKVEHELGSGGQGFAYLAIDTKDQSKIVLKEYILPVFVDMEARRAAIERFEREARTLQSLDSPRIVKLVDFFIEDHRAYLVMEHIQGENLKELIEQTGPASVSDCLKLSEQMCEILGYLHGLTPPLVHRDFTPDNLMLRPDGTLKLIDFNVAQQTDDSNFTGSVVGKHAYLPPEQFRSAACTQSDIYAMGCTLFYMLVGHDPEPISVSHPALERSDVSASLDAAIAKCTALDTEKRFADVFQLKEALNRCQSENATAATEKPTMAEEDHSTQAEKTR